MIDEQPFSQFLSMMRAGNYLDIAARASGLSLHEIDDMTGDQREQLETARAEGEARAVARIAQAAGTSWQAAAWMLERQYPDRWARKSVRPADDPSHAIDMPEPDITKLDELRAKRASRRAR